MDWKAFIKELPLKTRLLIKWYKLKTRVLVFIGRCPHNAVVGQLGAPEALCMNCEQVVHNDDYDEVQAP